MTVEALAREKVVSLSPDASITEAVALMRDRNVGSIVVVDDGSPAGILTDRDVALGAIGDDVDPRTLTVGEVMSEDLLTVEPGTGVLDLMREMASEGVRRVPVVEDGELLGIVTLDDLVVLLSMELQSMANLIRAESPPHEVSATDLFG
ncbi:MAG: CBS domain-containing protein [Haloarculaceae archaeon]